MLPTVTPPTDNLYKFLAIAGLVVFVASTAYPIVESRQLDSKRASLQSELAAVEMDKEILDQTEKHNLAFIHEQAKIILPMLWDENGKNLSE